ncbi:Ceramide-1-phosphate transfer protein [Porphyridium purpureum]|uniref:Ceramide-1-phosphate transfer protein n=1 Tax=Porphyridium purpureum TaxID=35688 RepID=A0A5J4YQ35_PORPP|nr:Ceramide-1-phosphate transfer protein [Porphyridium purpureum]|eukprot:POR2381..scf296_7
MATSVAADAGGAAVSVAAVPAKFDFERMLVAFEEIKFSRAPDAGAALPDTALFVLAMKEVALLFDHLGTGFGFVRADVETKTAVIYEYYAQDTTKNAFLSDMVEAEMDAGTIRKKPPPSTGRTLLRLMWATKFLYLLMVELSEAYKPDSKKTLKSAVSTAYDAALAPNHGWVVRKAVGVAVNLLPTKDVFLQNLGVDASRRDEYLKRVQVAFEPLVRKMYAYYEKHQLLDLP